MNNIPKVQVRRSDGAWLASCDTCGWAFWHIKRHVVDEQSIGHQNTNHRKRGHR